MKFRINGRQFKSLEDCYRYYHGWDGWPHWPVIDGEDAPVNTPEALGFYDRKGDENAMVLKNDDEEFEPSGN